RVCQRVPAGPARARCGRARRHVLLLFAVVAPIALIPLWTRAPLIGVGILALSHALLLYPTLRPNVQWLGPVITCFEPEGNELWLTIDDGPTDATLGIRDAAGVK